MTRTPVQNEFWNYLLHVSDAINDQNTSLQDMLGYLTTLQEIGAARFDPADQFEAYIAVTLCRAIQHKVEAHLGPRPAARP